MNIAQKSVVLYETQKLHPLADAVYVATQTASRRTIGRRVDALRTQLAVIASMLPTATVTTTPDRAAALAELRLGLDRVTSRTEKLTASTRS